MGKTLCQHNDTDLNDIQEDLYQRHKVSKDAYSAH